ncbi:MAG: ABC transporter ATP-binding protein [Sphingobium sp.]
MTDVVAYATGVVKRFVNSAAPALDSVAITITTGQMTGLVGPDGAGKTTLIRILAGLVHPDEGDVQVLGKPPGETDRSMIGYMPQRFGLYEDLSVIENLRLYADLRGLPEEERAASFDRLLHFTGLRRFTDRLAGKLSGGMKQKLGLACAMVRTPKLLLLDEPGVGVDPVSRRELWAMVKDLAGDGIGVLWSTAYLDEAEKCDTVTLLSEGKCLHAGSPDTLTDRMQGRVFRVSVPAKGRRIVLRHALDADAISDGTIQGASIRLTLKHGKARPPAQALGAEISAREEDIPPRFEDAFIDLLGGGPRGTSTLASHYREIPANTAPAIEAKGLTKRFGAFTAASDVNSWLLGRRGRSRHRAFFLRTGRQPARRDLRSDLDWPSHSS